MSPVDIVADLNTRIIAQRREGTKSADLLLLERARAEILALRERVSEDSHAAIVARAEALMLRWQARDRG